MPWLAHLVPSSPAMLAASNWALHLLHSGLILFVLTGWLFRPLLAWHLLFLGFIWASWIVLGLYAGNLGYCLLTDWHWQIKHALGQNDLPESYLSWLYLHTTGQRANPRIMSAVAAITLIFVSVMSGLRYLRRRRAAQNIKIS